MPYYRATHKRRNVSKSGGPDRFLSRFFLQRHRVHVEIFQSGGHGPTGPPRSYAHGATVHPQVILSGPLSSLGLVSIMSVCRAPVTDRGHRRYWSCRSEHNFSWDRSMIGQRAENHPPSRETSPKFCQAVPSASECDVKQITSFLVLMTRGGG